jgi:solute:Na+ symporter, SSS family
MFQLHLAAVFQLSWLDYLSFFGYFIGLALIGGIVARRSKSSNAADYFLAGRSLPWYVVGSSYIAANISTEHFIGLIGAAVIYGVCVATGEWSTVIAFTFLIWIFIPYLMRAKVYTAPEFLEKRFSPTMRFLFAGVTLVVNIVAFMGPVIYGGALIMMELFGFSAFTSIVFIAISSGIWAIWGGLKSIAMMDVLTIAVMIFGGMAVTLLGFSHLGGGEGVIAGFAKMVEVNQAHSGWAAEWVSKNVPHILKGAVEGDPYNRLSVLQPLNHYSNPWTHWIFSFFYIGLWYTVINQHMIQKVFAAKDEYHARMGMVFASFLKLLLPFIVVVPGLIFFAMKPDFLTESFSRQGDAANKTYIIMIRDLVPPFMTGILLAALFGAIQSTVCSVLNSTSTVFTVDFYKTFINRNASQTDEVRIGRIAGIIILALSIGVALILAESKKFNLFIWIQMLYIFFAPPFSATFLLGSLWKRVSGKDALVATFVSLAFAIVLKVLEFGFPDYLVDWLKPFANQGLAVWVVCMVVCTISAFITPPPAPEQTEGGLIFDLSKIRTTRDPSIPWYCSVGFWWAVSFVLMLILVLIFSVVL